jgi:ABC-type dipeptide/oligopeptide/nickel transport system permease component
VTSSLCGRARANPWCAPRRCAAQALLANPSRLALGREATPEAVETFNENVRFTRPLLVRYADWLSDAVRGDFGAHYTDVRA